MICTGSFNRKRNSVDLGSKCGTLYISLKMTVMSLSYGGLCSYANTVFRPTGDMLPAIGDLKL